MKTLQYCISPQDNNHYEKDTGMEVHFFSKDVNILIAVVEVAWW